jgi:hypothetical protein
MECTADHHGGICIILLWFKFIGDLGLFRIAGHGNKEYWLS